MNTFDLTGKTAVVTGGGSGIGEAIAKALASQGAQTLILERDEAGAKRVVEEIEASGGRATSALCDVSDLESVQEAFTQLSSESLDVLINNAGIAHVGNLDNTGPEDFDKVFQVNVKGVYNCLKAGIPMMTAKGGAIINVSSIAAHVGISDRFAYSMSKGAVHAMSLSVAKDYLSQNIRCNTIAPARVHTPFVDGFISKNYPGEEAEVFEKLSKTQPIGRMGKPEEIGSLVLYLCSDEASFITGSSFPIDGGFITLNG
ncbi:MAG: SDR family NAD(P)-dependent oxidoreductase [Opitutales bacterium]